MTADCITLEKISAYWKRFTSPVVQEEMEQSEHGQLLKSLSQRSFNQYAGDVPSHRTKLYILSNQSQVVDLKSLLERLFIDR